MKKNIIVLDTETTGIDEKAEILQLSIIDADENVLYNKYFKPAHHTSWDEAMRINGITPEMVADCNTFEEMLPEIEAILRKADCIMGYNVNYDIRMMLQNGLDDSVIGDTIDVMQEYCEYSHNRRWQKLVNVAAHFGYEWDESAHNSLGDIKATLYVHNCMQQKGKRK